ncbi:Dual specificity phosphatases [Armadillidium vulgare iridescent virus]|uniref:Dual specificity phosphatases n=1 Tax=Armadillidium vulgare iridescent virus TaxID=72201 RepID=A0A068QKX9_9VIRU|nr:Dual specificity phosphatases [Armadillidium vulgare iridescent virus]CCV02518.1 Dual specificity phosphatases [Armadillidium vulgare iridescent virus]
MNNDGMRRRLLYEMEEPTKIINVSNSNAGLYLGNCFSGKNYKEHGFTRIVNVTENNFPYTTPHLWISLPDREESDLFSKLESSTDYIYQSLKSGHKVLIHCQAGISRSATITIAFVMRVLHKNLDDALEYVKAKRPIVNPNKGFIQQLKLFENFLNSNKKYFKITTKQI